MKITVLGCGGSLGVPQIGCDCYVCKSDDAKNHRTRASILMEEGDVRVLIDASTDLRSQALREGVANIDAVIITHMHSDHVSGLEDLKAISLKFKKEIPVYMTSITWEFIEQRYKHLFFDTGNPIYRPALDLKIVESDCEIDVNGLKITLMPHLHGPLEVLSIRCGDFAYTTDMDSMPQSSLGHLSGIKYWVVDCLRYGWSPNHACYESSLNLIEKIKPEQAILTHMAHEVDFAELSRILPKSIRPAFDGLVLSI